MGYLEGLLIALLAFIVIGPKDFPRIMFKAGDIWRRLKMMGASLYAHLEDLTESDDGKK